MNYRVDESVDVLAAIVKAERVKRVRMEDQIQPILESFDQQSLSLFTKERE